MIIKLTKADRIKVRCPGDLFEVMQRILLREDIIDRDREHFWVVGLNMKHRIMYVELISLGSVNSTIAEPMDVFCFALQKRVSKVMLVHNHPTGELDPSPDDCDVTDRLIQVGNMVKIPVLDHLVISTRKYLSFANEGLMAELARSTKYVPNYMKMQRYTELAEAIGRERGRQEGRSEGIVEGREMGERIGEKRGRKLGRKEGIVEGRKKGEVVGEKRGLKKGEVVGEKKGERKRALAMAARMKQDGADTALIVKYTGLSRKDIEAL